MLKGVFGVGADRKKAIAAFIGCFLCMFVVQGGMQTFAIFLPRVGESTGWGVSRVSIASSTAAAGAFLANLAISRALKKLSPKAVLAIGIVAFAAQEIVFGSSTQPWMFWLGGVFGGIAMGWGTVATCSIIIDSFFDEDRSKFMAITVSGAMFGSVAFNPLATLLIGRFGWRRAYFLQGALVLFIGLAAVLLLIGRLPERKAGAAENAEQGGLTAAEAKRTVSYWLLGLGIFFIGLSTNIENYMPAFWQSRGVSVAASSAVMTVYAAMAAGMSILMGRVNDRLSGKAYVAATSLLFSGAVLIMARTGIVSHMALLVLCCLPFAAGGKKASALIPPLVVAEAFGRRDYPAIIGFFAGMLQLGVMASNFVIGPILEHGYTPTLTAMAGVNLAGLVCATAALIKKPYKE